MPKESPTHAGNIYPALVYQDLEAASAWLVRVFGFRERLAAKDESGRVIHAELTFEGGVVMLGTSQPDRGWVSPRELPAVSSTVAVYTADPDAHYARACAEGAEIVAGLAQKPYGARDYTARDLEGHLWTFGDYEPGRYWDSPTS